MKSKIKRHQNIYWAGFFDGEGYVTIRKQMLKNHKNPTYQTYVSIASTHKPIMKQLAKFMNHDHLTPRKYKANKSIAYYLNISSNKAVRFLELIYPYTIVKQKQIKLAIFFHKNKKIHFPLTKEDMKFRITVRDKITKLNHEYSTRSGKNK